jgi:hypothetical protein
MSNFFEQIFKPKDEDLTKEEKGDNGCPICHAPLRLVGPQKEGSRFNAYQCANGHEVLQ